MLLAGDSIFDGVSELALFLNIDWMIREAMLLLSRMFVYRR